MISIEQVQKLHSILIERFGGADGLRDISALQSALSRPFQTFDNKELYQNAIQKAASLIDSLINNHPFIDGNKRTGYTLLRLFLIHEGHDINATQEEKYDFVINIASGLFKFEEIVSWLEKHVINIT